MTVEFTFGSLFSGIGGIDLGLERTGMKCLWQVENNRFCQKILTKHFWNTLKFSDVKEFNNLISSQAGSLAKMSQSPGSEQGLVDQEAGSGQSSLGAFAYYDRDTRSWKTFQDSFLVGLDEFSGTWPKAGTMRSGIVYQQPPLVPDVSVFGSSFWPTITASEWKGSSKNRFKGSQFLRRDKLSSALRQNSKSLTHLNPNFAEAYGGFPTGWTELKPSEIPVGQMSQSGSEDESLNLTQIGE